MGTGNVGRSLLARDIADGGPGFSEVAWMGLQFLSFTLLLTGELWERSLFFKTGVSQKMQGL